MLLCCTVAAAAAATVLAATHDRVVTAQVYAAATAADPVWAGQIGTDPCMGMREETGPNGKTQYVCTDITGPAMDGAPLNFSLSALGSDGTGAIIEGQAAADVTRLTYVPVQGAAPIDVPLLPELPAPASAPAWHATDGAQGQTNVPVVDRRSHTAHHFAVASNDSSDALLLGYDKNGRVIGQGGAKLNDR